MCRLTRIGSHQEIMDNTPQKKKQGLPVRLTIMQRRFAELLVFNEGHKFAYECAKDAGYEGDHATLRVKASPTSESKNIIP